MHPPPFAPCRLFEIDPNLQDLFPFRGEVLTSETEGMKKHALGVMQTIDTAITMVLEGKIVELVAVLQELGTVHSFHNVEPQHFAVSYTIMSVSNISPKTMCILAKLMSFTLQQVLYL